MHGIDDRGAIRRLRAIAEADGFQIEAEDYEDGEASLAFAQRATSSARGFVVNARAKGSNIVLTAGMPPGMNADPATMQANMCRMLARIGTDSVPRTSSDSSSEASRTAPPEVQTKGEVLRPKAVFDPEAACKALEPGNSTIVGTACVARQGRTVLASEYPVLLYPYTPYMEEAVRLLHKLKTGKAQVELSQFAMATRMTGLTNEKGEFQFSKMKPGKYFLMATLSSTFRNQRQVKAGSAQSGNWSVDIYRAEEYDRTYEDLLERVVEVGEGQNFNVTLAPKFSFNIFRPRKPWDFWLSRAVEQ